jgi:L-alanine-DL-glutamate epimerase-like enolase superfamily enzyme
VGIQFAIRPYRLLFKRPFGTAHGLRDGTDALFIRLLVDGHEGWGEVTLPPYVKETVPESIRRVEQLAREGFRTAGALLAALDDHPALQGAPATRAGLYTAAVDALARSRGQRVTELLKLPATNEAISLMTIGICSAAEVHERLLELPASGALKLKIGDPEQMARIQAVMHFSHQKVLLDGNQGVATMDEAVQVVASLGDRLLGIEQPFPTDRDGQNAELTARTGAMVIGDESVQDTAGLEACKGRFGGVNLKLMKCGGLDQAKAMATRATELGLTVMLGSMSESSLGCTAMAQLAGAAAIVDLDGPWLLRNDPFRGIGMENGRLVLPAGPGLGAVPATDLHPTPIST